MQKGEMPISDTNNITFGSSKICLLFSPLLTNDNTLAS